MNDQIRGVVLGALAALIGWMSVTTVGLLVQVSTMHDKLATHSSELEKSEARLNRLVDWLKAELETLKEANGNR